MIAEDKTKLSNETRADSTTQKNTGRGAGRETHWSTRQLTMMAVLIALGTLLAFIPIPLIPGAPTLTYDPGNVPALLGGFAFGPIAGCIIGILSLLIHFLFSGDNPVGPLINAVLLIAIIIPSALIYRKKKTTSRLIIGLVLGSLIAMALVVPANLVAWYLYAGMSVEVSLPFIIASVLPFNLLKLLLNGILSFGLYKSLHRFFER